MIVTSVNWSECNSPVADSTYYVADNGETALELIVEHQPVVALLDIMMPKLSGLEVTRAVRENPALSAVGIMFLSARSSGRMGLLKVCLL